MEAKEKRKVKDGSEYNHLFPKAKLTEQTIKRNANVAHTVAFIPKVVKHTQWHTAKIAVLLKGKDVYETCRNIWYFVYTHITYQKDENGLEQIRSPARAWHDRHNGIDCDCYTVFISSILCNLHIEHTFRITKYKENYFQHIYPIVPLPNGKHITMDCVVHQFNYEEPYSEKQDTPMDLQFLNGVNDDASFFQEMNAIPIDDELGKLFSGKKIHLPHLPPKLAEKIQHGMHSVNQVNPATFVLRNGVLASMHLNVFKVAQRLKYAYLTPEQMKAMGIIPERFDKVKQLLDKIQHIYYAAGGKEANLRKAILKGRGNRKHEVPFSGLQGTDSIDLNPPINGFESYEDYNPINGWEELGEPVTIISATAAMTAASGIMASIAGLLKGIGSLFPKKDGEKDHPDFDETELAKSDEVSKEEVKDAVDEAVKKDTDSSGDTESKAKEKETEKEPDKTDDGKEKEKKKPDDKDGKGFWEENKSWLKPTAAVATGLTVLGIGYMVLKPKPKPKASNATPVPLLNGVPKHHRKKQKKNYKKAIALM